MIFCSTRFFAYFIDCRWKQKPEQQQKHACLSAYKKCKTLVQVFYYAAYLVIVYANMRLVEAEL